MGTVTPTSTTSSCETSTLSDLEQLRVELLEAIEAIAKTPVPSHTVFEVSGTTTAASSETGTLCNIDLLRDDLLESIEKMGGAKTPVLTHIFEVPVADADAESQDGLFVQPPMRQSLWATALLITTLCGVTFASSMTLGLLAVGLPTIADDLNISDGILLW